MKLNIKYTWKRWNIRDIYMYIKYKILEDEEMR